MKDKQLTTFINSLKSANQSISLDESTIAANRRRLEQTISPHPMPKLNWLSKLSLGISLAVLLLFVGFKATQVAADSSIPGDKLYALDRFIERVQLFLARHPQARQKLEKKLIQERLDELTQLDQSQTKQPSTNSQQEAIIQEVETNLDKTEALQSIKRKFRQLKQDGFTATESAIIKRRLRQTTINHQIKGEVPPESSTPNTSMEPQSTPTSSPTPQPNTSPPSQTIPESPLTDNHDSPSPDPKSAPTSQPTPLESPATLNLRL